MSTEVEDWFATLPDEQRETALILRELVRSSDGRIREELKWKQPCYSINSMVCYLQKARGHLSIGFREGARLTDPAGLLRGDGAQLRHIRIRNGDTVDRPALAAFLAEALKLDALR